MKKSVIAVAGLATNLVFAAVPTTPASVVATGLQVATCASLNGSGNGIPVAGAIDSGLHDLGTQCTGSFSGSLAGSIASSAQQANGLAAGSTQAQAQFGVLRLSSVLDTPGGAASRFPTAIAQASFVDTLTAQAPGLNGQNGFLLVPVHVSGSLLASGNAGSAAFVVTAQKNNADIFASNPGYVVGTGNQVSTDRQRPTWNAASFAPPGPTSESYAVNETVVFSVPVTFGTPFEMAVIGLSVASTRSSTGGGHSSTDFDQTVQWLGATQARLGDGSLVAVSVTSASGLDWGQAAPVPEPGSAALLLAGAGLLAWRRGRAPR